MVTDHVRTRGDRPGWMDGAVLVTLVAIESALLYKLVAGGVAPDSAELMAAISLVAILVLITGKIADLKSIAFGKDGFKAEALERLERRTDDLEREMAHLALSSMGKAAYNNLVKLASASFGPYVLEQNVGLHTELYYLRNLGFVELIKGSARSVHEIPDHGDQLSDYIQITDLGRKYIALRERSRLARD